MAARHHKMREVVDREQAKQAEVELEALIASAMVTSQQQSPGDPAPQTQSFRERLAARLEAEYI